MVLSELACVVRSKNAGPTLLTIDVLFADEATFARGSVALTAEAVAERYGHAVENIQVIAVPAARAVKIVLPRAVPAGTPGDRDVYGAQQHALLLELAV
ncbi:DUF4387 domain-containing protein [Pseudohalocynthiibacter sp. F2068]|jgi:Domain of unknown function (DUF4387)|uniref:DUF4387 domain-containing protein n=1 Tax=Pseudohalocynthiibacter sp. F2068 TaxID=2926418 RepID=UPI001FF43ABB|nr:DUF4387 domain-containing protein [Pseudohalocynthiibacter sp. F2068]MCK0100687.1 DUF4387 domain-containing protein [Pseudohalocynthiibacter sp. F2068]